ncbi:MAG: hypothetical protein WA989_16995 [Henriciella sp.]|uniref:hypothetical protein n=1 Tax=Henriciella sp. TaxID=1968823 RepID=UPI003C7364B5
MNMIRPDVPGANTTPDSCCARSALDLDASFCEECGKPLYRCMAHAECGGLLDEGDMCPVCVNLDLSLNAGTASSVREGGKLALPLTIRNASNVGRPLFITGLWITGDDAPPREIKLPFERIEPQHTANVAVRTEILKHAGVHQVDLLIAVSTRYQWRQEEYVFSSNIIFPVEPKDPGGPATTINVNAQEVGAGFTVYNPTRIEADRSAGAARNIEPVRLSHTRADAAERDYQKRGFEEGIKVPRDVKLIWRGFGPDEAPFDGPIVKPSGMLIAGRSSRKSGNDICLRAGEGQDELSVSISRLLFALYIESGAFKLRAEGQYGLCVNDHELRRTEIITLKSGDVIRPLVQAPSALAIKVAFEIEHGDVRRIVLTRDASETGA